METLELHRKQNRRRYLGLLDDLTSQKAKVFCAIPTLLHLNLPSLPGFNAGFSPGGFSRPSFTAETTAAARELFPETAIAPPPVDAPFLGLYAMGSVGSACFTSSSDIDFWLIHAPGAVSATDRNFLEEKLRSIESWANETSGLEVHFYVHDIAEILEARFADDRENAGEFGALLKEEFLRTALYCAGAEPAHWGPTEGGAIDFGPLTRLSTRQYLAACLVLLDKALDKPFKAALKIALLRRLAARPQDPLPAEVGLERIAENKPADAYMLLLEYLWEYFREIDGTEDFAFLKSALYLKIISEEPTREKVRLRQEKLLAARFQAVGPPVDLNALDDFFAWPFDERTRFSERIARFLQASLREISSYPDAKFLDAARIRGLTKRILLRHRKGFFIENMTFADVPSRGEASLSFIEDEPSGHWFLSLRKSPGRDVDDRVSTIQNAAGPVPLLAFALKNRLLNPGRTEIRAFPSEHFPRRAAELLPPIDALLSHSVRAEDLEEEERPESHLLVLEQPDSRNATTRRATVFTRSSWGSVSHLTAVGEPALAEAINHVLEQGAGAGGVEYISDGPIGPDPTELRGILNRALTAEPTAAWLVTDLTRYLLISNRRATAARTIRGMLLAMGRRGGTFRFQDLREDPIGMLAALLFVGGASSRINAFSEHGRTGFLMIDADGFCHGWSQPEEDARYSLSSILQFLRPTAAAAGIECQRIEYRKGPKNPWILTPFIPERLRKESSASQIHLELHESHRASARLGTRTLENQPLDQTLRVLAAFIKSLRVSGGTYPPYLSSLALAPAIERRVRLADRLRMKHELEDRIGRAMGMEKGA